MVNSRKSLAIAGYLITALLIGVSFWRMNDLTLFSDEAFTIRLVKSGVAELLLLTAQDVHPPLYYLFVKTLAKFLGYNMFVFRLGSLLPYAALLIWGATIFRHRFGEKAAILYILLTGLMPTTFGWTIMIRMYMLACLFVTLCFYEAYEIISERGRLHWVSFMFYALCAAYTHYFALIMVSFIAVSMFAYILYKNKKIRFEIPTCIVVAIVGYSPWLVFFIKSIKRVNESYWISGFPSVWECLAYVFGTGYIGGLLFFIFITVSIVFFVKESSISPEVFLILELLVVLVGTVGFGGLYSHFIKPIFITRYLLPIVASIWIVFAVTYVRVQQRKTLYIGLVFLILVTSTKPAISIIKNEQRQSDETYKTLQYFEGGTEGEVFFTDIGAFEGELFKYYFPECVAEKISDYEWKNLPTGNSYLWLESEINSELLYTFSKVNISHHFIMNSTLGKYDYYLYEIKGD